MTIVLIYSHGTLGCKGSETKADLKVRILLLLHRAMLTVSSLYAKLTGSLTVDSLIDTRIYRNNIGVSFGIDKCVQTYQREGR